MTPYRIDDFGYLWYFGPKQRHFRFEGVVLDWRLCRNHD